MSVVLGINAYHPGASAAIVVDGIPLAAIAEERLNRCKNFAGFPSLAVQTCLDMHNLTWKDIDVVSIGRDRRANRLKKLAYSIRHPGHIMNFYNILNRRYSLNNIHQLIATECDEDLINLRFSVKYVEHHLAHTASAYFISPWETAAGITIDGSGDFTTCMMSRCVGPDIFVSKRFFVPHSLGALYTAICQFIGFESFGDEGKVMGLAPLGADNYSDLMQRIVQTDLDGFTTNSDYLVPLGSTQGMVIDSLGSVGLERHYSNRLIDELGPPRQQHTELTQRDKDIACSLQKRFEEVYFHLFNNLAERTTDKRVVVAGGCALNSVANGGIFDATPFTHTCIQPAAGDDGLALGSALYVTNSILREGRRSIMDNAYLGPQYSNYDIESELKRQGLCYQQLKRDELLVATVKELVSGNVVGWFQGRMEWGPRALGNRSILAHPGLPHMKNILNARIKYREPFRPFAPSVLVEWQSRIFDYHHPSPFMLHVYGIRPEWRERLQAVNHVDNTGRLQTVSHNENPLYYDLIHRFFEETGIPVLLNTSFNENEPIVCKPTEAIDCFQRTRMDTLVIGSFFCRKNLSNEN